MLSYRLDGEMMEATDMYYVFIDGQHAYTAKSVSYAKKCANTELDCGAFHAVIYRGEKCYSHRYYNSEWKPFISGKKERPALKGVTA